ncbi:SDR family NAD(P)-dependent oxidoreductase [Candidatus Peregrinibacteria bacterium]|nr:SDR family NAD(P)-dependent oxidoreductase [Candidatus Peregrinibacteria bacterium]
MSKKKFLVTGGSGFIGSSLVKRLVRDGYGVRVLDNNSRGAIQKLNSVIKDIEFIEGDIRNADAVFKAAKGAESIIHLAFVNGTEFFYKKPELVLDVGVRGMLNVLDACKKEQIKELILASSSEVYQSPPKIPTDEYVLLSIPDVLNPRYSYAGGKIISELMAINYGRTDFNRVVIFRPHNVYGPDMGFEHVLPQFVLRAINVIKKTPVGLVPFEIQGDGTQTRAFVHIDDFTEGLMRVIENGKHLNIYHIGNPEEITIKEVARKVVAYLGRKAKIVNGVPMEGGTPRRCPDIGKLVALGFKPKISFDKGLPSIIQWYADYAKSIKS